jgi:hypothetical protein
VGLVVQRMRIGPRSNESLALEKRGYRILADTAQS